MASCHKKAAAVCYHDNTDVQQWMTCNKSLAKRKTKLRSLCLYSYVLLFSYGCCTHWPFGNHITHIKKNNSRKYKQVSSLCQSPNFQLQNMGIIKSILSIMLSLLPFWIYGINPILCCVLKNWTELKYYKIRCKWFGIFQPLSWENYPITRSRKLSWAYQVPIFLFFFQNVWKVPFHTMIHILGKNFRLHKILSLVWTAEKIYQCLTLDSTKIVVFSYQVHFVKLNNHATIDPSHEM